MMYVYHFQDCLDLGKLWLIVAIVVIMKIKANETQFQDWTRTKMYWLIRMV